MFRIKYGILIIMLLITSLNVKAGNMTINGLVYDDDKNIDEIGFKYYAESEILELNNYNGSYIYKNGDLNIILRGDNYMSLKYNTFNGITANNLIIDGDGSLTITNASYAIIAEGLFVKNANININAIGSCLNIKSGYAKLEKTNINCDSRGMAIKYTKDLEIVNSHIKINSGQYGLYAHNEAILTINRSEMLLNDIGVGIVNYNDVIINDSIIGIKSMTTGIKYNSLELSDNVTIKSSNDDIDYFVMDNYTDYKYIRVEKIEDELISSDIKNPETYVFKDYLYVCFSFSILVLIGAIIKYYRGCHEQI